MTAYGSPHQTTEQALEWVKKKEARKKVLAEVRARRKKQRSENRYNQVSPPI